MKYLKTFESYVDAEGNIQDFKEYNLDEVTISILDMDKINSIVDNEVRDKIMETDVEYKVSSNKRGLINLPKDNKMGGEYAVLDEELVGTYAKDGFVKLPIYKHGKNILAIAPSYEMDFPVEDLKEYVIGLETIKDFMGSRYRYNPRIEHNMERLAKLLGVKFTY
jgi:hypothetical protein